MKIKNKKPEKRETSKGHFVALLLLISAYSCVYAQTISPYLFGQNAWMPAQIGSYTYGGALASHWQDVQDSYCVSVRIGGDGYDSDAPTFSIASGAPTTSQLLTLINSIQTHGGEPIVQIDYGDLNTLKGALTSSQAAALVTAINVTNIGSIQRKVKYWIIGNEPNLYPTHNTAPSISSYIKTYSMAMKNADFSIQIIAPELSYYNAKDGTNTYELLTDASVGLLNSGSANDITGVFTSSIGDLPYVDYISFHYYPFSPSNPATTTNVPLELSRTYGFDWQLNDLATKISAANSAHTRTGDDMLKIAITEGNINTLNPSDMSLGGLSANSFIAGQFWAEMLADCMKNNVQFMNFWSVREGSDLGYLRNSDGSKRSTWWHFEMMANNFKGTYISPNIISGASDFKAFASYNSTQKAVVVMNQSSSSRNYSLILGSGTGGSYTTKINFSSGISTSALYNRTIAANTTTLFVFDNNGNISQETNYGLSDGLNPPANTCSSTFSCINQTQIDAYTPGVYSSVTIGGTGIGSSSISLNATHNTLFKSVGTITIDGAGGAFSSNNQALELRVTNCE